jgi:hypothetical protein
MPSELAGFLRSLSIDRILFFKLLFFFASSSSKSFGALSNVAWGKRFRFCPILADISASWQLLSAIATQSRREESKKRLRWRYRTRRRAFVEVDRKCSQQRRNSFTDPLDVREDMTISGTDENFYACERTSSFRGGQQLPLAARPPPQVPSDGLNAQSKGMPVRTQPATP